MRRGVLRPNGHLDIKAKNRGGGYYGQMALRVVRPKIEEGGNKAEWGFGH